MKFYVPSQHIGVKDYQDLLSELGHGVTIYSYSDHSHIMNWVKHPIDFDSNKFHDVEYCKQWCLKNKHLNNYDAFITFYPPLMSLLLRWFDKPIYMICPIRYELPYTNKINEWNLVNEQLGEMVKNNQLKIIANNLFDKNYTEFYTKLNVEYISSWCGYTKANYNGINKGWCVVGRVHFRGIDIKELPTGYKWSDINDYNGIITVPYNVSQMSFYENYAANIPFLLPTKRMLMILFKIKYSMQEVYWNNIKNEYNLESHLDECDWYNTSEFPYLEYWDSVNELNEKIKTLNSFDISNKIKEHNINRLIKIKEQILKIFKF